jgi:hypothetical protein
MEGSRPQGSADSFASISERSRLISNGKSKERLERAA